MLKTKFLRYAIDGTTIYSIVIDERITLRDIIEHAIKNKENFGTIYCIYRDSESPLEIEYKEGNVCNVSDYLNDTNGCIDMPVKKGWIKLIDGETDYEIILTSDYSYNPSDTKDKKEKEPTMSTHEEVCKRLTKIYHDKNADYGDSFKKSFSEFGMIMPCIRLGDKYNRLCSITKNGSRVSDESTIDTLLDLANYAIMTVMELESRKD